MKKLFFVFALIFCHTSHAGSLTYKYAPSANVKGDIEETDDLDENDDYTYLTLDPGTAKIISWAIDLQDASFFDEPQNSETALIYVDYMSINTEDDNGHITKNKFQSFSLGFEAVSDKYLRHGISGFGIFQAGAGIVRFNFDDEKYRGACELSAETGLLFFKTISLSTGVKFQIVGEPGETMAYTRVFYFGTGLRF